MTVEKWIRGSDSKVAAWSSKEAPAVVVIGACPVGVADVIFDIGEG